jgi:hypothetical protein
VLNKTAGRWIPRSTTTENENIYFIVPGSGGILDALIDTHRDALVALNDIKTDEYVEKIKGYIKSHNARFLIDSGTFALVSRVSRETGKSHSELFKQRAEDIPGFDSLWDNYIKYISALEDGGVWGYIELDFGGAEGKTILRKKLEDEGLRPIPVYHPLADPPEYFDTLCQQYDRIAYGGIVGLPRSIKKRIVATIWQRKQKYPGVWIHALGMSPNDTLSAYPSDSCDASSWLSGVKFGSNRAYACGATFSTLSRGYLTERDSEFKELKGSIKGWTFGAYLAHHEALIWNQQLEAFKWLNK